MERMTIDFGATGPAYEEAAAVAAEGGKITDEPPTGMVGVFSAPQAPALLAAGEETTIVTSFPVTREHIVTCFGRDLAGPQNSVPAPELSRLSIDTVGDAPRWAPLAVPATSGPEHVGGLTDDTPESRRRTDETWESVAGRRMGVYAPRPQEVVPMATEEFVDDAAEDIPDPDEEILDDDLVDDPLEVPDDDADAADSDASDSDEKDEDGDEAFDELEAEELEMLTEDETTETLVVDEAAEMRAIRRAELAMDQQGVVEATDGEFVCSSCFLVLKSVQLANPRKKICRDCAD